MLEKSMQKKGGNRQLTLENILPFKMNVVARPGDTLLKTQIFREMESSRCLLIRYKVLASVSDSTHLYIKSIKRL